MTAHCLFLHPNLSDQPRGSRPGATLSGGSWVLPLTNLQERELSEVARSASTRPTDTQFDVDFSAFGEIRAVVLVNHNLSVTARLRVTAWYEDGSYFSPSYRAEFDAYPTLAYTEDLPSEAENWWDGKPLTADIEGFTQNAIHVLPEPSFAPHWRIEIIDDGNPAGHIDIGRLWMATGWQPSRNPAYGAGLRYEDETMIEKALSGAEFFDEREPFRVFNIAFPFLPDQEALQRGLELERRAGTKGELFYIHRPDDAQNLTRLSFLARLRALNPWEQVAAFDGRAAIAFELKELMP
ncbi:hypothetical protein [Aureimonas sp. Leaf324]|jgi:hypothetical protein|uniref:hypothetical protein n=1 Tax=Aureimonas sp. Leaf324 TaxID=1736336 RepID=UPI0007002FB2|nr:hypothetical protein [Aureimonas sp. Leaf324]KQQ85075.1 hypothetical protein ASF65_19865 [Aureimonas sp. Leaf324]